MPEVAFFIYTARAKILAPYLGSYNPFHQRQPQDKKPFALTHTQTAMGRFLFSLSAAATAWCHYRLNVSTSISTMHWNGHQSAVVRGISPVGDRSKRHGQKDYCCRSPQSASLIHRRLYLSAEGGSYSRWKLKAADHSIFNMNDWLQWTWFIECGDDIFPGPICTSHHKQLL